MKRIIAILLLQLNKGVKALLDSIINITKIVQANLYIGRLQEYELDFVNLKKP